MKAFGLVERFLKGRPFKRDHIHGDLKRLGYQNWWEDRAEKVDKKATRQKAKLAIKNEFEQ